MIVLFFETYENIPIEFYCIWDNIVTCISPYRRSTIGGIFEDLAMHTYVFGKPSSFLLVYQLLGVKYLVLRYPVTEGTFPRTEPKHVMQITVAVAKRSMHKTKEAICSKNTSYESEDKTM
jgi:hypothetical protein